jgi:hypothetical protein
MKANQRRDQQIHQLRERGVPRLAISLKFGLTPGRIALIEREAEAEKSLAERRAKLRAEIRNADDLDKPWPVMDLIDALWLITIARMRLLAHFEKIQKTQMSLRELMDLAISETNDAEPGQLNTPLLRIRGIGKYGFYSVIAELTETDLGPCCDQEWRNRLIKLKRHCRIPSWPPNPRHRVEG